MALLAKFLGTWLIAACLISLVVSALIAATIAVLYYIANSIISFSRILLANK